MLVKPATKSQTTYDYRQKRQQPLKFVRQSLNLRYNQCMFIKPATKSSNSYDFRQNRQKHIIRQNITESSSKSMHVC